MTSVRYKKNMSRVLIGPKKKIELQGGLVPSKSNFDYRVNSMVSNSQELSFGVCHEKVKFILYFFGVA